MGKSKPRNRVKHRDNPAGKTIKPPSDPELAAIREKQILPVLQAIQSPESKTRSSAATAILNLIEDTKCRKLLLREQIVRILFEQTLTDSNLETRAAGWGILRNLALEEEADFCIYLYRQDVLTAIDGVIKTIGQTISSQEVPVSKVSKAEQNIVWNLTCSVVNLLTSLAQSQEDVVEAISKLHTVINFFFGLLSHTITPAGVQNEALSCLMTLTEDNKPLAQQISDTKDWLKRLVQIKDGSDFGAIAACGVLHNIFRCMQWFDHNTEKEGVSDAVLLPTLVNAMEQTHIQNNGTNADINKTTHSTPELILQLALEITASIATSLQEALEHGSRYEKKFEGFGDEIEIDNEMDVEGDNELKMEDEHSDEMDSEDIDADMEFVTGDGPDKDEPAVEEVTLDRLVRHAAPKILLLARTYQEVPVEPDSIQSHALSALNNIAWTVSSIDFTTGDSLLKSFWSTLAPRIWNTIISPVLASNTADIELASSITSLAWAVSRSVQGAIEIQPNEQRKFMALYKASKTMNQPHSNGKKAPSDNDDAFQSLGVKSIGVLGSLALNPAPVELNREIGCFLLGVLDALPETEPAEAVEALNQIFDIYADKSYDFDEAVFWGNDFYKHLGDVLPKAKKMAKAIDKRKFMELRSRADEAVLNLPRFLMYKQEERR